MVKYIIFCSIISIVWNRVNDWLATSSADNGCGSLRLHKVWSSSLYWRKVEVWRKTWLQCWIELHLSSHPHPWRFSDCCQGCKGFCGWRSTLGHSFGYTLIITSHMINSLLVFQNDKRENWPSLRKMPASFVPESFPSCRKPCCFCRLDWRFKRPLV